MSSNSASAVPESLLSQRALRRHTKTPATPIQALRTRAQHTGMEMDNSDPETDPDETESGETNQILLGPEQRQILLATLRKDAEFFGLTAPARTQVHEPIDHNDTRAFEQPYFPPSRASQEQNTHETIEAAFEESPQQSIRSDHNSARLIKTTPAQEDQLRSTLPSHFPPYRHVQNNGELGFYIDRSQYAISVGSGPLDDLHYGIIIVPFGEEHMLFKSEHMSRDMSLTTQREPSLCSISEAQPIVGSASSVAAAQSSMDSAALSQARAALKQQRKRQQRSSRITKTPRMRRQNPAPIRCSPRLNAGRHTT